MHKSILKPIRITSLKNLTQLRKSIEEDDELKKADEKLNELLSRLRAEVDRAHSEKSSNEWLDLLKIGTL